MHGGGKLGWEVVAPEERRGSCIIAWRRLLQRCELPMAPAVGRWAPAVWRVCHGLMATFFALAAFVQVWRPGPGEAGRWGRDFVGL